MNTYDSSTILLELANFLETLESATFLETSESETFLETAKCDFFGNGLLPFMYPKKVYVKRPQGRANRKRQESLDFFYIFLQIKR